MPETAILLQKSIGGIKGARRAQGRAEGRKGGQEGHKGGQEGRKRGQEGRKGGQEGHQGGHEGRSAVLFWPSLNTGTDLFYTDLSNINICFGKPK